MLDVRHAFGAARDDDIGRVRLHHHRRLDDRLEARAAAPIELEPRHRLRQSRGKPGPAADARRLAARIALAEDDIVDALGVEAALLDKRADHCCAAIARGERRERATQVTAGGPRGRDDSYAAHTHTDRLTGSSGRLVASALLRVP